MTLGPDRNLYLSVVLNGPVQNGHVWRYTLDGKPLGEFIASGEGGLEFPAGLRFGPDRNLYVASNGLSDQILRFHRSGRFRVALASNLDDLSPEDIAFAPDGLLDVTMGVGDSVYQYNKTHNTFVGALVSAGSGGLNAPLGLAFGPDHNL